MDLVAIFINMPAGVYTLESKFGLDSGLIMLIVKPINKWRKIKKYYWFKCSTLGMIKSGFKIYCFPKWRLAFTFASSSFFFFFCTMRIKQ